MVLLSLDQAKADVLNPGSVRVSSPSLASGEASATPMNVDTAMSLPDGDHSGAFKPRGRPISCGIRSEPTETVATGNEPSGVIHRNAICLPSGDQLGAYPSAMMVGAPPPAGEMARLRRRPPPARTPARTAVYAMREPSGEKTGVSRASSVGNSLAVTTGRSKFPCVLRTHSSSPPLRRVT